MAPSLSVQAAGEQCSLTMESIVHSSAVPTYVEALRYQQQGLTRWFLRPVQAGPAKRDSGCLTSRATRRLRERWEARRSLSPWEHQARMAKSHSRARKENES